jgi:hypothetical protein
MRSMVLLYLVVERSSMKCIVYIQLSDDTMVILAMGYSYSTVLTNHTITPYLSTVLYCSSCTESWETLAECSPVEIISRTIARFVPTLNVPSQNPPQRHQKLSNFTGSERSMTQRKSKCKIRIALLVVSDSTTTHSSHSIQYHVGPSSCS